MKKLLVLAIASILSLSASAQLISSNTTIHYKQKKERRHIDTYNRIGLSYDCMIPTFGDTGHGASLAWTFGFNVAKKYPIYLETGVGGSYGFDVGGNDHATITIPINLAYKIKASDNINIVPFVGPTFNQNFVTKGKCHHNKNFSVGVHAGVNFEFDKFYFGLAYDQGTMCYKSVMVENEYTYTQAYKDNTIEYIVTREEAKDVRLGTVSATFGFVF